MRCDYKIFIKGGIIYVNFIYLFIYKYLNLIQRDYFLRIIRIRSQGNPGSPPLNFFG